MKLSRLPMGTIEEIVHDPDRSLGGKAHFFGLGFIQVKLDGVRRVHFYHPDIPAFVEEPHDHRYHFISQVLRGRLDTEVWEQLDVFSMSRAEINAFGATRNQVVFENCKAEKGVAPAPYDATIQYAGRFSTQAGSSYYMHADTFHVVRPDFSDGPCVTYIERTRPEKEFARILKLPGRETVCPFSRDLSTDEIWRIIQECVVEGQRG